MTPVGAWPPETLLALGLLAIYLLLLKGHLDSIDGLLMYRQGTSLTHGSIQLVPHVVWEGSVANSKYGIGQSLIYVPFIAVGRLFGLTQAGSSISDPFRQYYADPLWTVACSWINPVLTATAACYVGKCLRQLGSTKRQIVLGVLAFGLASPALTYSSSSFAQPLTALTYVVVAFSLLRQRELRRTDHTVIVVAVAVCVTARPVEGVVLGLGALSFLLLRHAPRRAWLLPMVGLGVGVILDLAVNQLRFGSVFETGYGKEHWEPSIAGVLGLSVSPGRGIIWFMPFCLLMPWGAIQLFRRGRRRETLWLLGICTALFFNAALWDMWWGGVDWGPRLLVPALPLMAVLAAPAVTSARTAVFGAATIVVGFVLVLPTILVDPLADPATSSRETFQFDVMPFFSAWKWVERVVPVSATDQHGIDLLWLRMMHHGGAVALLIPMVLLVVAVTCFARAMHATGQATGAPRSPVTQVSQPRVSEPEQAAASISR